MRTTHPSDPTSAGFCFAVPMSEGTLDDVVTLRVVEHGTEVARRAAATQAPPGSPRPLGSEALVTPTAGGVDITWDPSLAPVVMVRDADRGECLGFARNGHGHITGSVGRLELLLSDGVHTRTQSWVR